MPKAEPTYLVFTGRQSKLSYTYRVVKDDGLDLLDEDVPELSFKRALSKGLPVGGVILVEMETKPDGGRTVSGERKFVGRFKRSDVVVRWRLLHNAADKAMKEKRELDNVVKKSLDPACRAYWNASSVQRPYILAQVISYIMNGR